MNNMNNINIRRLVESKLFQSDDNDYERGYRKADSDVNFNEVKSKEELENIGRSKEYISGYMDRIFSNKY